MSTYVANIGDHSTTVIIDGNSPQEALLKYFSEHHDTSKEDIELIKCSCLQHTANMAAQLMGKCSYCTAVVASNSFFNYYVVKLNRLDCKERLKKYMSHLKKYRLIDDFEGARTEWWLYINTPAGRTCVLLWLSLNGNLSGEIQRPGAPVEGFTNYSVYRIDEFTNYLRHAGVLRAKSSKR